MLPNTLVTIKNPFDMSTRRMEPVPFLPGRTVGDLAAQIGVLENHTVIHNGHPANLKTCLMPGDVVHAVPQVYGDDNGQSLATLALTIVAYYYVGPAVSGALEGMNMSAGAAAAFGAAASAMTMYLGGMLVNDLLGPSNDVGAGQGSPTYGWSVGKNTTQEGIAVPVMVGNVATWPQIINQWIEVDGDDQWIHTLLSVGEGQTNNVPAADSDIYVGDQPLTFFPAESYEVYTTDGGPSPAAALTHHERLHQMRGFNKEMHATYLSSVLHHFNGADEATDFEDHGIGQAALPHRTSYTKMANTWTAQGGAQLSTTHPFVGTANLDLTTAGAHITNDNWFSMDLWLVPLFGIEFRFRQSSLTNAGIIGQELVIPGGDSYYWGIFYHSGNIVYQQYKRGSGGIYTVYYNVSVAVSLSVDTWHKVFVACESNTIYILVDGVLQGSGAQALAPEYAAGLSITSGNLTPGDSYVIENLLSEDFKGEYFYGGCAEGWAFIPNGATSVTAINSVRRISDGTAGQAIGKAQYYNGTSDATVYGNCELDELRLTVYQINYDLAGYTPPTTAIHDEGVQTFVTRGHVDSFSVTTQCPHGLYISGTDGSLYNAGAAVYIGYREIGTTEWTRQTVSMWAADRNAVTDQWPFEPAAGRGKYEIQIAHVPWINEYGGSYAKSAKQSACYLLVVDEILAEALTYPHLQLVALSVLAQNKLSGNVPPIKIISNRTSITVPNYNGIGTRTVDPTNNANCAFDLYTNDVYGAGIDPTRIIEADFEAWADWCDGTVDGEKRAQINMAFDKNQDLDGAIHQVEMCGRVKIFPRGTRLTAAIQKPATAAALFVPANIVPGTNSTNYLRQSERSDAVEVVYYDKDKEFARHSVMAKGTGFDALTRPPRVPRLEFRGINNADQATREAILRQQLSESIRRAAEFQTGIEGLPVTVGDVFNHSNGANTLVFSGRLTRGAARAEQWTGTTVYLDQEITLDTATYSGNCIMLVRNPDDSVDQYTISGPFDTATRSVTVSASGTFDFLSPFMVCRSTGEIYQFRVTGIQRSGRQDVRIVGNQYAADAYYHDDYDSGSTPI